MYSFCRHFQLGLLVTDQMHCKSHTKLAPGIRELEDALGYLLA